jgi:hypothetical protein
LWVLPALDTVREGVEASDNGCVTGYLVTPCVEDIDSYHRSKLDHLCQPYLFLSNHLPPFQQDQQAAPVITFRHYT